MPIKCEKRLRGQRRNKASAEHGKSAAESDVLDRLDPLGNVNSHVTDLSCVSEVKHNKVVLLSSPHKLEMEDHSSSSEFYDHLKKTAIETNENCSSRAIVIDHKPMDVVSVNIGPLGKKPKFNYSFTDTTHSSFSSTSHSFTASNFYKGKASNPLKRRLLSKRTLVPCPADKINKNPTTKKGKKSGRVVKSKKKVVNKAKKIPVVQVCKNNAPCNKEDLASGEKENPVVGRKFFTARPFVKSQEKVFTTALAWKAGVHVVKSGSTVSVKSEPLVKKTVRHPRIRLMPISKEMESRKFLKAVENVTKVVTEEVIGPKNVQKEAEQKVNKCIIIRISPFNGCAEKAEQVVKSEELHTNYDAGSDTVASFDLAHPNNSVEGNVETDDAKLYPLFRRDIMKKQRHEVMMCSSTPKIEKPFALKQKRFIKEAKDSDGKEQMIIDAGQKEIGAKHCSTCNMVYAVGDAKDEKMHLNYHEKFLANLKFPGWKKENILGEFVDGKVIMVTKQDRKYMLKKVEEILYIVNRDLGFPDLGPPTKPNATYLLYISNDKQVVGCLIAESITQASRIVLDSSSGNVTQCLPNRNPDANHDTDQVKGIWCCGSETVKVICGINRIWTAPSHRRLGIATRMVDCLRCNFVYGYVLSTDEMAFSDPSVNGREFAASYTGTPFFLVYK